MDLGVLFELDDMAPLRLKESIDPEDGIPEPMPNSRRAPVGDPPPQLAPQKDPVHDPDHDTKDRKKRQQAHSDLRSLEPN